MHHLWKFGVLIGLAALVVGPWSAVKVWRHTGHKAARARWAWRSLLLTCVAALFFVMPYVWYPAGNDIRIFGVPFFSMIWAREGEYWTDFIGPYTCAANWGNAIVGAFLPFIAAHLAIRWRTKTRSRSPHEETRGK